MSKNQKEKEELNSSRSKFLHLTKDIEDNIVDLCTIDSVLYHMGYILVGKKELHECSKDIQEEVTCARDATRVKICRLNRF